MEGWESVGGVLELARETETVEESEPLEGRDCIEDRCP